MNNYCQYLDHVNDSFMAAGEKYEGKKPACDKVARFRLYNGWWFCAEHYDLWVSHHAVPL